MGHHVRAFMEADESWVRREWEKSQLDFFGQESADVFENAKAYTKNTLDTDLLHIQKHWGAPNIFFIAQDQDGKRVGCIAVKVFSETSKASTAELFRLFTTQDSRGKGIGKLLVSHCENWAKEQGKTEVILETTSFQIPAVSMYISLGYSLYRIQK